MRKVLVALSFLFALALGASPATAQPSGSSMASFRFGPALGINDANGQLHIGFDYGIAMSSASRSRVYFILPLEFGLGGHMTRIQIEPGVRVDVRLPASIPLYISPHAGAGFGIMSYGNCRGCDANFAFALNLGAELKFVLDNTWNFTFAPMRLDFWPVGSNQGGVPVWYSMLFGVGMNF